MQAIFQLREPRDIPVNFDEGGFRKDLSARLIARAELSTDMNAQIFVDVLIKDLLEGQRIPFDRVAHLTSSQIADLARGIWEYGFEAAGFRLSQETYERTSVINDPNVGFAYAHILTAHGRAVEALPIIEKYWDTRSSDPGYRYLHIKAAYHAGQDSDRLAEQLMRFYELCDRLEWKQAKHLFDAYANFGIPIRDAGFLHSVLNEQPDSVPPRVALISLGVENSQEIAEQVVFLLEHAPNFYDLAKRAITKTKLSVQLPSRTHVTASAPASGISPVQQTVGVVKNELDVANELLAQGRLQQAETICRQICSRRQPDQLEPQLLLAKILYRSHKIPELVAVIRPINKNYSKGKSYRRFLRSHPEIAAKLAAKGLDIPAVYQAQLENCKRSVRVEPVSEMQATPINYSGCYTVYVDGAFKAHTMGIGWVVYAPDGQLYSEGSQIDRRGDKSSRSSSIAEALALLEGLRKLPAGANAVIFIDSLSVLDVLEGVGRIRGGSGPIFEEIDQTITTLGSLDFRWVRSHEGLPGNEKAHDLANIALAMRHTDPKLQQRHFRL